MPSAWTTNCTPALACCRSSTVTDTIRTAIEKHLETLANDPTITAKAKELTAEIDKEAELQRQALSALLSSSTKESAAKATTRGSRSAKG